MIIFASNHHSIAIAHPVCLSPMISSRWPRPIGTRLSTALMPVCMGSLTEILGMMPGAFRPTRRRPLALRGPCTVHTHHVEKTLSELQQKPVHSVINCPGIWKTVYHRLGQEIPLMHSTINDVYKVYLLKQYNKRSDLYNLTHA